MDNTQESITGPLPELKQDVQQPARVLPADYDQQTSSMMEGLATIQKFLGLEHWRIHFLKGEPADPGQIASITMLHGYQEAGLQIRDGFFDHPDEEISHALTHELIHLHFERACAAIDLGLQVIQTDPNTQGALDQVGLHHQLGIEQGVEGLARVLAPLVFLTNYQRMTMKRAVDAIGLTEELVKVLGPLLEFALVYERDRLVGTLPIIQDAQQRLHHAAVLLEQAGYLK